MLVKVLLLLGIRILVVIGWTVDKFGGFFFLGSSRSSWSCYFFPETSQECREYAFELLKRKEAWERGIITVKENYTSKEIWSGKTPR